MNLMLFGAPGAGKGTQAKFLIEKYNIPQISTGDILRAAIVDKTDMGMEAKKFMDAGQLVPDSTIIGIIKDRLAESDCKNGFILDGFPRTIIQARELESIAKEFGFDIDAVINIDVPSEKLIKRLSGRRTCKDCGTTYHVVFNPPKTEGVCDKCGGELYQRPDESEEAVQVRLDTYEKQTRPLIDYYTMKGELTNVNGDQSMDAVYADIKKNLEAK